MSNETVLALLKEQFPAATFGHSEPHGLLTVEIDPALNTEIMAFLKNHKEASYNFLTDICGLHYPDQKGKEIGVVYHLHSFANNHRIRLKCFLPSENPSIRTLIPVFPGANWMERESFDFFGINFLGHPNLTRILNLEDMNYHPLLKQYPLEDPTREDKNDSYFGR